VLPNSLFAFSCTHQFDRCDVEATRVMMSNMRRDDDDVDADDDDDDDALA
jgi:hypothetical protein